MPLSIVGYSRRAPGQLVRDFSDINRLAGTGFRHEEPSRGICDRSRRGAVAVELRSPPFYLSAGGGERAVAAVLLVVRHRLVVEQRVYELTVDVDANVDFLGVDDVHALLHAVDVAGQDLARRHADLTAVGCEAAEHELRRAFRAAEDLKE